MDVSLKMPIITDITRSRGRELTNQRPEQLSETCQDGSFGRETGRSHRPHQSGPVSTNESAESTAIDLSEARKRGNTRIPERGAPGAGRRNTPDCDTDRQSGVAAKKLELDCSIVTWCKISLF